MIDIINSKQSAPELYVVRNQICNWILMTFSVFAIFGVSASLWRIKDIGWLNIMGLHIVGVLVLWGLTLFRKKIPYNYRAVYVVFLFTIVGISGLSNFGTSAPAVSMLVVAPILTTVLFGWRAGITLIIIITTLSFAIAYSMINNRLSVNFSTSDLMLLPSHWVTFFMTFLLSVGTSIAAMIMLNKHLLSSLYQAHSNEKKLSNEVVMQMKKLDKAKKIAEDFDQMGARKNEDLSIALKQLEKIEQELAEIIWGTNVGTWVWNVETGETVFNDRWAEIIGYSLEEISPISIDTWMRFSHPDDIIKSGELLEKNFTGELDFYECEVRLRHKCGEWVWVLDRGKVVEWTDDGKPLRLSGTHTDITERKIAEELFAKNATHFRLMFEQNASVMLLIEPVSGKIVDANTAAAEFYGYPLDQLKTMLINQINMLNPSEIEEQLYLAKQSKQSFLHIPQRLSSGEERIVEVLTSPMQTGRQNLVFAIMNDVTEFEESQAKIVLAASVFESSREGIMITEADGMIIDVNDAFTRITGYSKKEVIGNNPRILASGLQDAEFYESMWHSLKEKGHWYGEIWNRRRDGEVYAEMQTITTVNDPNKGSKRYVALFSDITSVKEHEKQLEHIAHFDALTGLPNRVLLADRLHQAMSQALRRKQQLAVAFIDLDGFKEINDHFGHEAGDQLLVALAKRMKDGLREGDTLSRIGGDEFVAVITDLGVVEDCLPMLNRLLASAAEPVIFSGTKLQVSASLGVTFYPQLEAIDADQLQRQADQAMYQAKQSGKNRYHIFDAELDRSVRGHHETLERIRHALLAEEFRLYYQPKVNMHSGKFVGAEALIRWQHPDQGLLLPAVFLPVVEDHELAVDIDEWVIKTAILQMEAWQQEGHDIPISVNIGARLLQKSVFVQWLQSILEKHPLVKPGNLRLEVLETSALEDIAQVSQVIEACAQMGVLFALDDFGTGYSSLTYLKRLAVAELKIDQTFVRDMLEDPDDLAILEGVIGLAEAFHRDVIAEGVETIEHGRMLLQLGCELAQGYGIARPMPVDQLSVWAASWKAPESWTNCNKIKHEDQPLLYAIVEHRAWIENLKRYFEGLQDTPPQMNYHQCRFGIMMEHVKQNGASLKNLLDPIDPLHQKVHRLATELCELKASGNSIGAQERLGELYDLRNELTDKIEDVLASRYRDFH